MTCRTCNRTPRNDLMFCRHCLSLLKPSERVEVVKARHCKTPKQFETVIMAEAKIESILIFHQRLEDSIPGARCPVGALTCNSATETRNKGSQSQ